MTAATAAPIPFASDNWAPVHPAVMTALQTANTGSAPAYGADQLTTGVEAHFRRHFGPNSHSYLVPNGTSANLTALSALLAPYEAVICATTAHINVDECGGPESTGIKLLTVATPDGKLRPADLGRYLTRRGDQHAAQPKAISLSQVTELGTCYTPAEITAIAHFAHDNDMYLHIDGARLSQAAAWLGVDLAATSTECGADAISFGGSKNGIMYGEAVILANRALDRAAAVPYLRKQRGHLVSKMRYVSAQFAALLEGELWRDLADHANHMAARLAAGVSDIGGITITQPVQSNAVFALVPPSLTEQVVSDFPYYIWDEHTHEVRWMTSWHTTEADVDAFVAALAKAATAL